jgi:hypothetical protein
MKKACNFKSDSASVLEGSAKIVERLVEHALRSKVHGSGGTPLLYHDQGHNGASVPTNRNEGKRRRRYRSWRPPETTSSSTAGN